MDPLDILNLLRAAVSLGAEILRLGYRNDVNGGVRNEALRIAPRHRALLTSEQGMQLVGTLVIDESLLHDLMVQIDEAQARYRRALRAAETPEARRAADLRAEQEICEHLNRIRARNGGTLPLDALRAVWLSYGCDPEAPRPLRLIAEAASQGT